jgi:hypothetical protein
VKVEGQGTLVITGATAPDLGVTVEDGGVVNVTGGKASLTISGTGGTASSQVLYIDEGGEVNLVDGGSLVLGIDVTTGAGPGASVKGPGMLKAGSTVIIGGGTTGAGNNTADGWQVVNGDASSSLKSNVTISAGDRANPHKATIVASVKDTVLTAGAGASIQQLAEEDNSLTIGDSTVATVIDLGSVAPSGGSGSVVTDKGRLILTGHQTYPGKIILANNASIVKTGNPTTSTIATPAPTNISGKLLGTTNLEVTSVTNSTPLHLLTSLTATAANQYMTAGDRDNTIILGAAATVGVR